MELSDNPVVEAPPESLVELSRASLVQLLDELKAFEKTRLYSSFRHTLSLDLEMVEQSILNNPPSDTESVYVQQRSFGARDQLRENLSFFEDARAKLEERLAQLDESPAQP